jgi:hypothetical protein
VTPRPRPVKSREQDEAHAAVARGAGGARRRRRAAPVARGALWSHARTHTHTHTHTHTRLLAHVLCLGGPPPIIHPPAQALHHPSSIRTTHPFHAPPTSPPTPTISAVRCPRSERSSGSVGARGDAASPPTRYGLVLVLVACGHVRCSVFVPVCPPSACSRWALGARVGPPNRHAAMALNRCDGASSRRPDRLTATDGLEGSVDTAKLRHVAVRRLRRTGGLRP